MPVLVGSLYQVLEKRLPDASRNYFIFLNKKAKDVNRDINIKAMWIRKRKEGLDPDSLVLRKRSIQNPLINVDPFSSTNRNIFKMQEKPLPINLSDIFFNLN